MENLKIAARRILLGGIVFLVAGFGNLVFGQQPPPSIRQHITIGVAHRPCDPAQVKQFALGKQPREAVLAQVTVQNNADKPIAAMKLAWRVYAESRTAQFESCASHISATVLASGSSQLISFAQLQPNTTATIAINPRPVDDAGNQTTFIDRPLVTVDDLRPLVVDGKLVPPGNYGLVIFVSEIQYLDGTTWASPLR